MKKITLIGFMRSGKTSVSIELGKKLQIPRIEMDDIILQMSGRKSVSEIFDKDGEIKFRELEIRISRKLKNNKNIIISAGGGIIMNKINLDYLKQNDSVIFLKTSFEIIKKRLKQDTTRPLFRDLVKAKKLYDFRQSLYLEYANLVINTDDKTIKKVCDEIYETIGKK